MKRKMLNQCKAIVLSIALATAAISPVIQPTQSTTVTEAAKKTIASKKVTFSSKKRTVYVGDIVALKAVMKPANSTDNLTWTSSNKKIATVNKYGIITAKAAGTTTITVKTSSGKTDKCTITVKKVLTESDVKKIVEENTLSEDDVKKIVKEVKTDDEVKKLIKDNTVSESEIINLINKYATGTNTTTYVSSGSSSVSNSQIEEIVKETLDKLGLYNNEKFDEDESAGKDVPCDSSITFPYTWICYNEYYINHDPSLLQHQKIELAHDRIIVNSATMKQYSYDKKSADGRYYKYKEIATITGTTSDDVIESIEKYFSTGITVHNNDSARSYGTYRNPYKIIKNGDGSFTLKYVTYSNLDAETFKINYWESICCEDDKYVPINSNTDTSNTNQGSGDSGNNSGTNTNIVTVDVVQEANDKLNIIIPNLTANSVKTSEISVVRSDGVVIPVKSAITYEEYTPGIRVTTFTNMTDGKDYTVYYKPSDNAYEYRGTFTSFSEPKEVQFRLSDELKISGSNIRTLDAEVNNNTDSIQWSCSDDSVIQIIPSGNDNSQLYIRPRKNGTAIITGTVDGLSKQCNITVSDIHVDVQDIWMDNPGQEVRDGDVITVYVKVISHDNREIAKINLGFRNNNLGWTSICDNLEYIGDNIYKVDHKISSTDKLGKYNLYQIIITNKGDLMFVIDGEYRYENINTIINCSNTFYNFEKANFTIVY